MAAAADGVFALALASASRLPCQRVPFTQFGAIFLAPFGVLISV